MESDGMAIDFTLTAAQQELRDNARDFAQNVLAPLVKDADASRDPQEAFAKTKPAYIEAYRRGLAMGFLPKEYGGGSISNLDLQIAAEEVCAVDPGFATTILVNGLGLMNVVWFGTEAEKEKWIRPATTDPTGEYLAGWVVSEPAGRPGGTATFDAPQPHPVGIGLVAERRDGEYVINGRKYWPCNAAGWDKLGANVNVCIVRTDTKKGGKDGLSAIMVPRGTPGFRVEKIIDKMGHRLCQNASLVFEDVHVPEENVISGTRGNGDLVISKAFTWSGPVAAIAAVGVARAAYEYTLEWAKGHTGGGAQPIVQHQHVGYLLSDVAMKIEAARYLSWKAAQYLDLYDSEGHVPGAWSKIYGGEMCVDVVSTCMRIMGVNSYDRSHPLEKYMREALCFPIYDAGNIGMQRRKVHGVMAHDSFDPRAFLDNKRMVFTKEMEGIDVAPNIPEPAGAR
jgi:alkylation response protein AidB-like acyl-CoA dehydrogenase